MVEVFSWILVVVVVVVGVIEDSIFDFDVVEIKWFNDVFFGGFKILGILMEFGVEVMDVFYLVFGIGVNLNVQCDVFFDEFWY